MSITFGAAALPEPERKWLAAAERLPIESIWQGGHLLPPTGTGEAITRLALLTAWTERVRIGTAILLLPLYQPVVVAKQLADLDSRSGRPGLGGLGVGGEFAKEFEAVGVPVGERGARTDEAIEVLRALWRGGPVSHHGRFFDFDDVELRRFGPPARSRPAMQPGGPPLLVSGPEGAGHAPGRPFWATAGCPTSCRRAPTPGRSRPSGTRPARAGRDLDGFEWMMYLYCSVRRDGDQARDDVARFLGGAYGDKPGAMLDRIASGRHARTRWRPGCRSTSTPVCATSSISPAAHEDTLEVVQLAAEEVPPAAAGCHERTVRRPVGRRGGGWRQRARPGPGRGRAGNDARRSRGVGHPGGWLRARRASTSTSSGAGPGTGTSAWSAPTTRPTIRALLERAPTSRSSTGLRTWSKAGGSATGTCGRSIPGLVYARCRPSRTATGTVEDFGLLVEARSGFCTQLPGHRPGPIFVDVRAPGSGAAFLLTASVLALLRRRALTGEGGWAETSLYDGMLATLGCMIGRSERAGPGIETYWEKGSWFPNFLYRCADGELIQVWFGGKGMYAKLIEVLGDEPSEQGYYTDQATGALNDRAVRWTATFATQPRDVWIERLRAARAWPASRCSARGKRSSDPHLREIGLARSPAGARPRRRRCRHPPQPSRPLGPEHGEPPLAHAGPLSAGADRAGLLEGIRVADFSMFVAGPLAGEVLADLGADVIKVEPPQGEAMRGAAYAMAACQRGKRSLAIDITAPEARPVVDRLLRWADVVAAQLPGRGVGAARHRRGDGRPAQPRRGVLPRQRVRHRPVPGPGFPGNDALMQALTGFEQAVGGAGNDPIAATWIPIDMAGGWIAAVGHPGRACTPGP